MKACPLGTIAATVVILHNRFPVMSRATGKGYVASSPSTHCTSPVARYNDLAGEQLVSLLELPPPMISLMTVHHLVWLELHYTSLNNAI